MSPVCGEVSSLTEKPGRNMSAYHDNPPGPENRDIAGIDSEEQFKPLPRKYPTGSNPVVYPPHRAGTGKSSRV
jgi:hypothetical protein